MKIIKTIKQIVVHLFMISVLVFLIVYIVKSYNSVIEATEEGQAQEKLDTAMKIFASSDELALEEALNNIDGLEELNISEEGIYTMKIDGYDFLVISQENNPEEEETNTEEESTYVEDEEINAEEEIYEEYEEEIDTEIEEDEAIEETEEAYESETEASSEDSSNES